MKGVVSNDKWIQTEDNETTDYIFFQNMVEDFIKIWLNSNNYKAITREFKLKDKQKKELMIDFFKFKIDIKNKIQSFIDKLESAYDIKKKIEHFVQIREEEELKNPNDISK